MLVAVGASQGEEIWRRIEPSLPEATVFTVNDASLASAGELQAALGERGYDAVVGIGGGRTLDVAKYAATRAALPMVAVATNLAHDGICSPVASLEHAHGKGSYGVAMPLAVVVDLDYVRAAPRAAGRGPASATWSATCRRSRTGCSRSGERGEPVDGLAMAYRATAGGGGAAPRRLHRVRRLPHRPGRGAGAVRHGDVGGRHVAPLQRRVPRDHPRRRPALPRASPTTASSPGIGALFATFLREDLDRFDEIAACLRRHELPLTRR